MIRAKTLLSALCLTLLAGCSTMMDIRNDARDAQSQARNEARELLQARAAKQPGPAIGPVITTMPYVDTRPTPRPPQYPVAFSRQVTVNEPMGVPIRVLAQRVQAMTGVRMLYQSELVVGGGFTPDARPSGVGADATLGDMSSLDGVLAAMANGEHVPVRTGVSISYTGDVVGLFNAIAAATGSNWEYNEAGEAVQFYRYKTETFRVPAVQGVSTSTASMGGKTQSSGGEGGGPISMAAASASHTTSASIWEEIESTIKQLLSEQGVYAISPATGSVTVRDHPDRIETVRGYLQETADALTKQVDVEVTIYRVVINDADTRAVNWKGLFRNMLGQYSIGLNSLAGRPDVISGGLSSVILDIPLTDASGAQQRWGGSQLILDALSSLGRTSVVTNTSVLTSNNQPAPVKIVRRTSYLASVAQNLSGSGDNLTNTGPTLTPGMVETGLNLYVLPHVMEDGKRMLLKLMVSLSTLESLDSFGTETAKIQLPQIASREFEQQAWLNSGETLVLAGFEQVDSGLDTRTPLDKALWFLGGSSSASKGREMVVIAIHPTVTAVRSRI